jgi:hypothetical protein
MPAGNRSLLVILDSRRAADRERADTAVFAALDHFGAAYEVLDGGDYWVMPLEHIAPRAAYVFAHDGAGAWLKPDVAERIAKEVRNGAGLLAFDREADTWPPALRSLLPHIGQQVTTSKLCFSGDPHFITSGRQQDEEVELGAPLDVVPVTTDDAFEVLLTADSGDGAIARGSVGDGRVVLFGTGNPLYTPEVFGHACGLDGLMWRALVWTARKPFPMRCIPPFITARMDDCNGASCAFGYVDALNRYGIAPNLGLFIDEMGPTDWTAAKRLFGSGGADFSMHAFRDDLYKANPDYRPYAVLEDKPDLSDGGRGTRFEGLSLDHDTGRDLDDATVERNFERMDEAFARAGIKHSRLINAHFGEIGWRAVPRFLKRGIDMPCNNSVVGQLYGAQPVWRPRPYGARGPTGRHGLVIDRCPQHPGLMFVHSSPSHLGKTHMVSDILSGHVPFLGESDRPRLREAAERGTANIRLGLDSLAFGAIMTHEQRINAIGPDDWRTIVDSIVRSFDGWDVEFAAREHVSIICKRLFDSGLVHAEATGADLHCELCGRSDGPSPLTIWENEGDACVRRVVDVPPFDGFRTVSVE